MSDLLAPVLCEIKSESEAFWCFFGLMRKAIFVCTPTDNDIDKNLVSASFHPFVTDLNLTVLHFQRYLRELIRLMVPKFYLHMEKHNDAQELLFCHRWILLYVSLHMLTRRLL